MTIRETLNQATKELKTKSTSPNLDAEVLLAFVLNKPKEYLLINPSQKLLRNQLRNYNQLIQKRILEWPVAYLIGHKEFFGLDFIVTKDVLIPRPETEGLVELILSQAHGKKLSILDIGTGSGNIIITLAKKISGQFFASDISHQALAVAKRNAKNHNVKITFKQGSLLQPWKKQNFDIIVANLPYLPRETDSSTKFEPKRALIAKNHGLALYEELFKQTATLTSLPSSLLLEIGHNQRVEIKKLAKRYLPAYETKNSKDLTGRIRIAVVSLIRPR